MGIKKLLILILIIILMSITLSYCYSNFWVRTSKHKIIKSFKDNKELFEKSIEELASIEELYITVQADIVKVYTFQNINGKTREVIIKDEDYYKYEQTISLMKLLELKKVSKTNEYTTFLFDSSFYPGSKEIVNIIDSNSYIMTGNKIREKEQLVENWYYIVMESL